MNGFAKKTLAILCVVACVACLALTVAVGTLSIDLGSITVHAPANVVIDSAFIGDVSGVIGSDGQSVVFSSLPDMVVGDQKALTVSVKNIGELTGNLTNIAISGQEDVLTFTQSSGTVPSIIEANATSLFTWNIAAVKSGVVHPVITIAWTAT